MTEFELTRKIEAARKTYHEAVQSDAVPSVTRKMSDDIKAMMQERSKMLSKGAEKCPTCGNFPVGMKKRRGEYEVGCLVCPERARGESVDEAVFNWNEGNYAEKSDLGVQMTVESPENFAAEEETTTEEVKE